MEKNSNGRAMPKRSGQKKVILLTAEQKKQKAKKLDEKLIQKTGAENAHAIR
jgi:hypothetical protein